MSIGSPFVNTIGSPTSIGGVGLPQSGLLLRQYYPNSDALITGEEEEIPEGEYDWAYQLSEDLFDELGECIFFTALGVPIAILASDILLDAGTNNSHILFKMTNADQETGRLVIYHPSTSEAILTKAKSALGIV